MKKTIYILVTIFLGLLLSFILHGALEIIYLKYAFANDAEIVSSFFLGVGWCALPIWTQYTFLALGIIGGYFLGQYWWNVVYVQKRHWRFRKKQGK